MLHLLRRHPIPIACFFRRALVVAYAFPPRVLESLLPEGLVLDTWRGQAFLAVALVETENLRPRFLPVSMGKDFFLIGYRIFARLAGRPSLRGLRILRSETDSSLMARAGNFLTHYNYTQCEVNVEECGERVRWVVGTSHAEADLDVIAQVAGGPAALPAGSPFLSMAEARRFAGPLPYTFDYEAETGAMIAIEAVRQNWNPQPVAVEVRRCAFIESEPFRQVTPVLANAFYVHDVPYAWQRGRRVA